ncbi:Minor capsid protein L2 [Dissostichus eleginoides]|uniref:Minor capsid protein L2 n=1 Tax=Dissostichus eleginoides TaxID=100907 RepID=A0AAD9BG32_DISEL|nr:Minor capsid protein L2 [Dissostichus eleginoides]
MGNWTFLTEEAKLSSVSKVVQAETNRDGMLLTLEVQTKIPVATETLYDASLTGWSGPNKTQPSGQRGNGTAASWASTSRPSTTLQTNSALGHKPRATWNLSLPAVHCWFTPQNPSQAKGLNVFCT